MPLTNVYIGHSSPALWLGIRLVLLTVGLAAAALAWALCSASIAGAWRWPVVIGGAYFAFHTLILDAVIWPALFK
jgi:hypothetical protein